MTMRDDTEAQGDANERANVAELRGWLGDRVADLIAHVGCGDLDARGQCERCNAIRAALAPVARRLASAPPAAPPEDARDSHLDAATWRQAAVYLRNRQKYFEEGDDPRDEFLESASDFDRFAAEAASAAPPDPPGLRALQQAGMVVLDAQRAARQSDPPGLVGLVDKHIAGLRAAYSQEGIDMAMREMGKIRVEALEGFRDSLAAYDLSAPASPAPMPTTGDE